MKHLRILDYMRSNQSNISSHQFFISSKISRNKSDKSTLGVTDLLHLQTPPTLTSLLFGKPVQAHLYIERIPVEKVPENEEEASKWLHQLYVIKVCL